MNEHDLIANLLRGAEKQQSDLKSACTSMDAMIGRDMVIISFVTGITPILFSTLTSCCMISPVSF